MLNTLIIRGRLGVSPENIFTQSGTEVSRFRIAHDVGSGEKKKTEWYSVKCFNKTAELAKQYLTKGDDVIITGRLSIDTWQDRNTGESRSMAFILCDRFERCGGRRSEGGIQQGNEPPENSFPAGSKPVGGDEDMPAFADADEIPF